MLLATAQSRGAVSGYLGLVYQQKVERWLSAGSVTAVVVQKNLRWDLLLVCDAA